MNTQLPNSHSFKYSGLIHSKYDVGVCWLDKYGDVFPYTDEYINKFKDIDKEKKFLCLKCITENTDIIFTINYFITIFYQRNLFFYIRSRYKSCRT